MIRIDIYTNSVESSLLSEKILDFVTLSVLEEQTDAECQLVSALLQTF